MQKDRGDESSSFPNLMSLDQFSRFIIDDSFLSQEGSTYPELILFFGDEDLLLESLSSYVPARNSLFISK